MITNIRQGIVAYNNGERGTDLLKSIAAGASIGLLISGATMSVGAVIAGAIGGAGVTFLGASVAQIFAIGALSVDTVSFIIAPLFGIVDAAGIEWEPLPAYGSP